MSKTNIQRGGYGMVWPMLLDYSRRECLQLLRRLELETYSNLITVFRAQGVLTNEKRKILHKLQRFLNISVDRHKAEVRRALNDEELATISETMCGKGVTEEWLSEGRRIAPVFQRPSANTIFLPEANKASSEQLLRNSRLPLPVETAEKNQERLRLQHRLIPSSISNNHDRHPKVTTAEKYTETLTGLSIESEYNNATDVAEPITQVHHEITCTSDAITSDEMRAGLMNGHAQTQNKTTVEMSNIVSSAHSPTFDSETDPVHCRALGKSLQDNESLANDTDVSIDKHQDVLGDSMVNSNYAASPRRRSISVTSVPASTPLPNLVHNAMILTNQQSRPIGQTGSVPITSYEHHLDLMSNSSGSRLPEPAVLPVSKNLPTHTTFVDRGAIHGAPGLPISHGDHSASSQQPHLLVHLSKPIHGTNDSMNQNVDSTSQSVSCVPTTTIYVSSRPLSSTATTTRLNPSVAFSQSGFKTPSLVGARVAFASRPFMRSTVSPPESRSHSGSATSTISVVQNIQGSGGSSTADQTRPLSGPSTTPRVTSAFTATQLITESITTNLSSDTSVGRNACTVKRLVCSTNSLTPLTSSANANANVIVFQRGVSHKYPTSLAPSVKVGPNSAPCSQAHASGNPSSAYSSPRPIRIVNIPSAVLNVTTNPSTDFVTVSSDAPDARTAKLPDTSASSPFSLTDNSIPALLHRASHLNASMDVDLDADDPPNVDPTSNLIPPSPYPAQSAGQFGVQSDVPVCRSNSLSDSPYVANTVPGLKVGQLRTILGLTSRSTGLLQPSRENSLPTTLEPRVNPDVDSSECNWNDAVGDDAYPNHAPKRIRLSPRYSPSHCNESFSHPSTDSSAVYTSDSNSKLGNQNE